MFPTLRNSPKIRKSRAFLTTTLDGIGEANGWAANTSEGDANLWGTNDIYTLHDTPMDILLNDPKYLGAVFNSTSADMSLFSCHIEDIKLLWEYRKSRNIDRAWFVEAIGSGKSTKMRVIAWLAAFELLTWRDFHKYFHITPGSAVSIIFMSRTESQSRDVLFNQILPLFNVPFFRRWCPPHVDFDKVERASRFPSRLRLPGFLTVFPGTGEGESALGYSPYVVVVDEMNHLRLSASSVAAAAITYRGKRDEAQIMFDTVYPRIGSRFSIGDERHGLFVGGCDPRFTGDFLERQLKAAMKADDYERIDECRFVGGGAFCVRRPIWKARPEMFVGKDGKTRTFKFDTGSMRIAG